MAKFLHHTVSPLGWLDYPEYFFVLFQEWAEKSAGPGGPQVQTRSNWPVLLFLALITAAPYIIMKMLGSITNTIEGKDGEIFFIFWRPALDLAF